MSVEDWLEAVTAYTPEQVYDTARALRAYVEELGDYRIAASQNIAINRQMTDATGEVLATSAFGWPDIPGKRWWSKKYLSIHSPLPIACRFEAEPFWVNASGFHTAMPNPQLDQIDLDNFEERSFAAAALVVPVHLPFGVIGAAAISSCDQSMTDFSELYAERATQIGLICRRFVASYLAVMGGPRFNRLGTNLSAKEIEILRWAAAGKTDLEICIILSRSRATIRYHLANAATKLDTVNRSQAVVRATQLGYLACGM